MLAHRAVCYSCDLGFLFPTIVSAISLRRAGVRDDYIVVGVVDGDTKQLGEIAAALTEYRIAFEAMPRVWDGKFDTRFYDSARVPHSALARLFLADLLPASVNELLYLDGDTLALRDITPLVHTDMPTGHLGAVDDLMCFLQKNPGSMGNEVRAYFQRIGLQAGSHYFNSGVVRASRTTYREICADAFAFLCANTASCTRHDQSALNAVSQDRRTLLSLRFNWWPHFSELFPFAGSPHVMHFAGLHKPWRGAVWPARRYHSKYMQMAPLAQQFGLPLAAMSKEDAQAESRKAMRRSIRHWTKTLPNTAVTAWRMMQYERTALRVPAAQPAA